jgi:2',3'-cyclic-nucleotide 2'-phosphodiesterase (5'-nucleotidase family)
MKYANNKWIATAGRYGSTLGQLVLDIDEGSGNIRSVEGSKLIEIKNKNRKTFLENLFKSF